MTSDMNTQVRAYTEYFYSTIDPVELEEIFEAPVGPGPVRPLRPPVPPRRRWLVAVAAAVIVLVAIGIAAWLAPSGADRGVVDEPTPTTIAQTTTTVPSTTAAPPTTVVSAPDGPIAWTAIETPIPRNVTSDGDRFFALTEDGGLLASGDGVDWETVTTVPFSHIDVADDGRVMSVDVEEIWSDGVLQPAVTVYVVDIGGTITESTVEPVIPEHHARLMEGGLGFDAAFVDGNGILLTAAYQLSTDRIVAAGLGVDIDDIQGFEGNEALPRRLADSLGITVEQWEERQEEWDGRAVTITGIGETIVIELSDLGLGGTFPHIDHPMRLVSADGTDWEQIDPVSEAFVEPPVATDGGLLGQLFDPSEAADGVPQFRLAASMNGVDWTPIPGSPSSESGPDRLFRWGDRVLFLVAEQDLWIITSEEATPLDTAGTEFENLDRGGLTTTDGYTLSVGGAGIAYLTGFTEEPRQDPSSPTEIVVSADGEMWTKTPLPDTVSGRRFQLTVGANGFLIVNEEQQAWFGAINP